jgi:uncharacterized sporulation protein YeaH/YhbH (DUF444 family)
VIFFFLSWLLHESTTVDILLFQVKMSSSDSDTATTDVSMAAREQEEHIQEAAQSTPSQKSAGGRGKGRKKTKQSGLTEAQKEEVLEFLKERPYLYNKDFKDQAKRNRNWKELADRLGVEAAACIGWYRSMRTMLARAKKAKSKSGSGSANLPPFAPMGVGPYGVYDSVHIVTFLGFHGPEEEKLCCCRPH